MNSRETLDTQLNVFADFDPRLSPEHRSLPYLFLANIDPELQLNVLGQMEQRPKLVAADTMNFWIGGKLEALNEVVRSVDVLFVDENEIRQFAAAHVGAVNVVRAARFIQNMGPETVIVKRGDHGLIQFMGDSIFAAPAYPLDTVVDPHRRRRLLRRGVHRVPGRDRRPGPRCVSAGRRRGVGHGLLRGGVLQRRAPGRPAAGGHRRPVPGLRQHQPVPGIEWHGDAALARRSSAHLTTDARRDGPWHRFDRPAGPERRNAWHRDPMETLRTQPWSPRGLDA